MSQDEQRGRFVIDLETGNTKFVPFEAPPTGDMARQIPRLRTTGAKGRDASGRFTAKPPARTVAKDREPKRGAASAVAGVVGVVVIAVIIIKVIAGYF